MKNIVKNWQDVIKPYRVEVDKKDSIKNSATVVIEPLERGFGLTVGNALRRVLLSSIQGSAVTSIKVQGALSEFSSVEGVKEDVIDIVLNIKSMRCKLNSSFSKKGTISVEGPCVVTADMIKSDDSLEFIDPAHKICTLDTSGKLDMELTFENGKGYVPAAMLSDGDVIGQIVLDAHFSPIKKVSFEVEDIRAAHLNECEKLSVHIETDGSISPEDALASAAEVLRAQFESLLNVGVAERATALKHRFVDASEAPSMCLLLKKVKDVDFSVRCLNCMENSNIVYVADLVRNKESDLLKTPNFGKRSLTEIKVKLQEMGLSLGMDLPDWPPQNMQQLIEKMSEENL